jgi:hypothetical protein
VLHSLLLRNNAEPWRRHVRRRRGSIPAFSINLRILVSWPFSKKSQRAHSIIELSLVRCANARPRSFFASFALSECDDRKNGAFPLCPFRDGPGSTRILSGGTLPSLVSAPFFLTILFPSPDAVKYPHISLPYENCFSAPVLKYERHLANSGLNPQGVPAVQSVSDPSAWRILLAPCGEI